MYKKLLFIPLLTLSFVLYFFAPSFAHVVVKPAEVGIGAFQTFTVGVPNEKDNPTVGLRLLIPEGVTYVSPNVKPGWNVEVAKKGEGEDAPVSEITWSGGSIPQGQRDDFIFSAKVPAKEATLAWKAYQTYQDGETVEWIHESTGDHEDETKPPFSTTKVINDLTTSEQENHGSIKDTSTQNPALPFSIVALALSAAAITLALRRKK